MGMGSGHRVESVAIIMVHISALYFVVEQYNGCLLTAYIAGLYKWIKGPSNGLRSSRASHRVSVMGRYTAGIATAVKNTLR